MARFDFGFQIRNDLVIIHGVLSLFVRPFFPQCFKLFLILGYIRQGLVRIQVQCGGDRLGLAHILEHDLFPGEQLLEHVGDLELGAGGVPFAGVFPNITGHIAVSQLAFLRRGVLGDVNGVVHQAHPVVGSLVLKGIAVLLTVLHHKVDDGRRCVRDFNGVRLDVGNSKAPFLDLVLEVDHKQGSALGDDIVFVPVVPEGILEVGRLGRRPN